MKKVVGLFITSMSILFLSIIIMLAKISMHIDKATKSYNIYWFNYIPKQVYILILLAIGIGVYLFFQEEKSL